MGWACGMDRKNADGKKTLARPRRRLGEVLKRLLEGLDGRPWTGFIFLRKGKG
jgi:hypothetical protein